MNFCFDPVNLRKLPANFSAKLDGKLFPRMFRPSFSRISGHPKKNHGEKESIHRPAPVRDFSLPKRMGPQRKDFGGGYGFPAFYIGFWYQPRAWNVFL